MPSRRSRFESACRIGAFALLGWLLGESLGRSSARRTERVSTCAQASASCDENLATRLSVLTRAPDEMIHLDARAAPPAWATDWLAALAREGTPVSWSGSPPATVLAVQPIASPEGGVRIDIAAAKGSVARIQDDAGELDRVTVADLGATVVAPSIVGAVSVDVAGQPMRASTPRGVPRRNIVVVGSAGWEGKFIVDALEESGWPVAVRFAVAPGVDVTSGASATLDTSRTAAVIAIDSGVRVFGPVLERFVRSGGGLILAGSAAASPAVAALAPGAVGARTHPTLQARDTIRLGTTGFYPVVQMRPGTIALERRPTGVTLAARRVGAGRVLQAGYDDSWRWRMAGAPGSDVAHRQWWTRAVESVAYVPVEPRSVDVASAAPLAYLIGRIGPPRPAAPPLRGAVDPRILMAVIMILLLLEWTSRRLRGMR